MTTQYVPYQQPHSLISFEKIGIEAIRSTLSRRIHNPSNRRSTAAFMDDSLVFVEPALLYDVAVEVCEAAGVMHIHWGYCPEFTARRQRVIASIVAALRQAGAVPEQLLRSDGHYCGRFKLCIGCGYRDATYLYLWLVPIWPAFFWGEDYPGVEDIAEVVHRRRLTGLAQLQWVTPVKCAGGSE